ncbi:DUF58 domain-containing protein [Oscillatoriales cyanobacterium LEGE 11467]|uniref:DUF58 domain-containing protein n=1 Tax=Zarconia navalis LEGE 11467 TaxID=1828826 RepID=A0A928ZAB4_9CYAN|nr:DUF58 domain-containing protein [Zarconia navalis]MBE9042669.1 DUF58 domain-containing protein [Zarconia navalis LEGE 11467]
MKLRHRLENWLEARWVKPAYAGGLLLFLSIFFFGAATNTMAGWLYVISGASFALLGVAMVLPPRSLRQLEIRRRPLSPISAGDELTLELEISNPHPQPKTLLQVRDIIPLKLGEPVTETIEIIPSHSSHKWTYYQPAAKRGVYHWDDVQLRTAAPLGLFWCRRHRQVPGKAIVYPRVLPLSRCPLIDESGMELHRSSQQRDRQSQMATEGLTRALRPYRSGDPIRLIHWRSSARYGDLRVRELEVFTSGWDVVVALDNTTSWEADNFEEAAIAAASLYFYASQRQLNVRFWSATTGLLQGHQVVLEALAAVSCGETNATANPPSAPSIWLTQNPDSIKMLPSGSRWLLWQMEQNSPRRKTPKNNNFSGMTIDNERPLQVQLQSRISAGS